MSLVNGFPQYGGGGELIDRPDLWAANMELDFGSGLYGYRAVGNIPDAAPTAQSGIQYNVVFPSPKVGSGYIVNVGGQFKIYRMTDNSYKNRFALSTQVEESGSVTLCSFLNMVSEETRIRIVIPKGGQFSFKDSTYDIWILYKK